MKRPLIRLFYLVASLALVSLNNNAAAHASPLQPLREEAPAAPSVIYLPMVRYDYIYLPPIIPETTNVLTVTTTQHLAEISSAGSVFTFTQRTPALDSLTAGDVIAGEPTMAAPSGFLRRVAAISSTGSQVVVRTDPATLEEAIQQGTAQVSQILSPENVLSETRSRGVNSGSAPLAAGQGRFYLDLTDVVLYDEDGNLGTTDDQITANGSLVLKPGFNFRILVKDWQLKRLNFTIDVTETAELQIDAGVEVPLIQQEVEIASYTFAPIVVMIGPFPIWFTPELAVNVGLDGSVNFGVSSGVTQEATLTAGVKYDHEGYGPIQGLTNSFQYNLPTLYASMDMKGYAGAELSLKLYGVAGAFADANLYLELEADPTADPWWQLYGGLEAKAGVEMEIFSYQIASYETPAMGYRWLLTQATGPANLLDNPGFEGQLAGWNPSSGSATYTAESLIAHSGSYSVKGVETSSGSLGRLYQDVTNKVTPGNLYKITGWIKTEGVTGNVIIALDYVTSGGWTPADGYVREIGFVTGTQDWTYFRSDPFILPAMPADASALWFLVDFNAGAGTAYWDDLTLQP